MSLNRDAKLHSIQAENNSSGNNKDDEFVDGLKHPTQTGFVIPDGPFVLIVSMELSETLMSCKSCGIGHLKTVPVRR